MGRTEANKEVFSSTGPYHLTDIDWANLQHRRTIMASLIQGVYVLENDNKKHRQGNEALGPPWWESFNFSLHEDWILRDTVSIFGAIFKFEPSVRHNNKSSSSLPSSSSSSPSRCFSGLEKAPRYVVAFRGTTLESKTIETIMDIFLDVKCGFHILHKTNRFRTAFDAVKKLVQRHLSSAKQVWLAGYSLGSAIAMLVGKKMIHEGFPPLETYLFNSPFPSLLIESIKNNAARNVCRVASSFLKIGVSLIAGADDAEERPITTKDDDTFDKLSQSGWAPYLFVHRNDWICSGFVGYFKCRKTMRKLGLRSIEGISTKISRTCIFTNKGLQTDTEPLHILPSATMVVSLHDERNPLKAHCLSQWYQQDLRCDSKLYPLDEII